MGEVLTRIIWISLGSTLGGNARYWLGSWIQGKWGTAFPMGTFFVNISGAFILGLFIALAGEYFEFGNSSRMRLFFAVGFLGSYTTFSTLEYDTFALAEVGAFSLAALNLIGSLVAGFVAVWLGTVAGRSV